MSKPSIFRRNVVIQTNSAENDVADPRSRDALRIEARGRLVEQDYLGFVDQAARDRQAPLHAARERFHIRRRTLRELDELQELVGAACGNLARNVEIARAHQQV
jgi:hypothetical protein